MKMKEEDEEVDGRTHIHNVRFYNLTPRSILCLAYNKINKKLALSRNDNTVEIWDMRHAPFHEKTIITNEEASIEGIAWSGQRFFTVGLGGELIEWDLTTLTKRQSQLATGNSIWCLDVNPEGTQLALGTEEGYINIFDISENQMVYSKLFDKQEGRILCCKFDASGKHLVTGGVGAIRIWDVKTGHALHRMTLSRKEGKKKVIVWSLQVLHDMTIISGDSRGIVTVWDGLNAAHIEEHYVLKADVLAVTVTEEENMLICSGIDPIIRIYALTEIKREDITLHKWVKYRQRNVHDHDVKALVCMGDNVLSGGMDGYLGISSITRTSARIVKLGPFLQGRCATVAAEKKLLLLRYPNTVEIWRLGETTGQQEQETNSEDVHTEEGEDYEKQNESKTLMVLKKGPQKLLEMKSKYGQTIICSTLSPDGNWLVYSTMTDIRLFSFTAGEGEDISQLIRIKLLPDEFSACKHILFTDDSSTVFLVKVDNTVDVFNIMSNGDIYHSHTIEAGKYIKDTIHLVNVSKCGNYFVTAGTCRTIAVWSKMGQHYKHHLNLPRYTAVTTAVSIHHESPRLVATFSDSKIFEYDLEEMCFTCTDKDYFVKDSETHCVNNIVLDRRNPNVFVLHNDSSLFVLEKCSPDATDDVAKKSKRTVDKKTAGLRLKFQKIYEHLIDLAWLSTDELVAVGVNPISLIEQLPGAFKQKKFGAA